MKKDMFSIDQTKMHTQATPWGQEVLIADGIDLTPDKEGNVFIYPEGDRTCPPSAVMPKGCYFINAIERQVPIDDANLDVEENMEEFGLITEEELDYIERQVHELAGTGKAVVGSFGGTALGDVAFVPGMGLKDPHGIRSVAEWYMSTMLRPHYVQELFERQIDLAIQNYEKIWKRVGDKVDVIFTCGTDFGTQNSQFCSLETFDELWKPYYRKFNDWVHSHTTWKVFKHSCGAILPILPGIIEAGFDIINPVQINAKDMDTKRLKNEFGKDLTFWGGGIDTQRVLPSASPDEVKKHVRQQCEILGKDGGFVFNSVHNIQANVPVENVVAMIDAIREINDEK